MPATMIVGSTTLTISTGRLYWNCLGSSSSPLRRWKMIAQMVMPQTMTPTTSDATTRVVHSCRISSACGVTPTGQPKRSTSLTEQPLADTATTAARTATLIARPNRVRLTSPTARCLPHLVDVARLHQLAQRQLPRAQPIRTGRHSRVWVRGRRAHVAGTGPAYWAVSDRLGSGASGPASWMVPSTAPARATRQPRRARRHPQVEGANTPRVWTTGTADRARRCAGPGGRHDRRTALLTPPRSGRDRRLAQPGRGLRLQPAGHHRPGELTPTAALRRGALHAGVQR